MNKHLPLRIKFTVLVIILAVGMAGCALTSDKHWMRNLPKGSAASYETITQQGYIALAKQEAQKLHLDDALHFQQKSSAAQKNIVLPDNPEKVIKILGRRDLLTQSHARVTQIANNRNLRKHSITAIARLVLAYDCWLMELENSKQYQENSFCYRQYRYHASELEDIILNDALDIIEAPDNIGS